MIPHPIESIHVTEPVTAGNLTIFPLTLSQTTGPDYIPLATAIEVHGLIVKEISESGSVPDLHVENPSAHCVLLLDGEELRGAKQNRIVNTTLLLAPRSRTQIPVSCTESGRWHYHSEIFACPKSVMPVKARRRKTQSVSESLKCGMAYSADQGMVWDEVEDLHQKSGSQSGTRAMADALNAMRDAMENATKAIQAGEDQCGFIAFINGEPAGLEFISRPTVYAELHTQLIQSYAAEAVTNRKLAPTDDSGAVGPTYFPDEELPKPESLAAKTFLEQCAAIPGKPYASVGLGTDWRFLNGRIVGSGLEVEKTWIHMAYFVEDEGKGRGSRTRRMARSSERARYRHRGGEEDVVF
jgi:hypothetical protein